MIKPNNVYSLVLMKLTDGTVQCGSTILQGTAADNDYETRLHAQRVFALRDDVEEVGTVSFTLTLHDDYKCAVKRTTP